MNHESQIIEWLVRDEERVVALEVAASLGLNDWCLAAGFVRNIIWDKLHGPEYETPLNDIDLVYFNASDVSEESDRKHEKKLKEKILRPWSVKNQARMHLRNADAAYSSTSDAMTYWPEVETAIGVSMLPNGKLKLMAPFGYENLFKYTITLNNKCKNPKNFQCRVNGKGWLNSWPKLTVNA